MTKKERSERKRLKEVKKFRDSITSQIKDLKREGKRLEAIKMIRTYLDLDFKNAKIFYKMLYTG
jgi:hypothetical protein